MKSAQSISLFGRASAIWTAARRAATGQPPETAIARTTINDFAPVYWGGRRMTPDQVRMILQAAVGGNIDQQWALFDLMEDTWPRLEKNLNEVKRAASRTSFGVKPYAKRGEKPDAVAIERASMVEAALRNWRPEPGTLELSFEDSLYNALDALGKGISVQEITWQRNEDGLMPRCAHFLHPSRYGWNADGNRIGLTQGLDGGGATWQPFNPGQFWVGFWNARSGAPGQTALLRCLAPYWIGITFGWEWLLNNAQIFGVPLRWATYDPSRPDLLPSLTAMLTNLGSAGWAAFPEGTTLDFKEAISRSTDNPQVMIQTLADKTCDLLILGQEASSESKSAGIGNGASELHGAVRDDRLQAAAQWCADLLNYQLVPAVLRWNYGDESSPPTVLPDIATDTDPKAKADRDVALAAIAPLPRTWFYERHGIPEPDDGELTIGGPGMLPNPLSPSQGGVSSGTGPGGESPPGADPGKSPQNGDPGKTNGRTATPPAASRKSNPPRSAVPLNATDSGGGSVRKPVLPGGYQPTTETERALAEAHARDFAPFRKAAEPLLAAIEAGDLALVGRFEAFIAELDAMAPQVVGASELADTLEAALAEAAISGAAQSYGKISNSKS